MIWIMCKGLFSYRIQNPWYIYYEVAAANYIQIAVYSEKQLKLCNQIFEIFDSPLSSFCDYCIP
jgi:hypothetical protein